MKDVLLSILCYGSALFIPAAYLVCTRFHGTLARKMLRGVGLQILWTVAWAAIGALLLLLHVRDMYMFPIWLVAINLGFIIYFSSVVIMHVCRGRELRKHA